jgi:hypothetical protein
VDDPELQSYNSVRPQDSAERSYNCPDEAESGPSAGELKTINFLGSFTKQNLPNVLELSNYICYVLKNVTNQGVVHK